MAIRDLLTYREAAEIIGVSPARVRQFVMEGRLKPIKPQREVFLDKDDVEAFAKEKRPWGVPRKSSAVG